MGVQCKQKSGLLRTRVTVAELDQEVEAARGFRPTLARFILATTGPRDAKVQERARELTEPGLGTVVEEAGAVEVDAGAGRNWRTWRRRRPTGRRAKRADPRPPPPGVATSSGT